MGGGGVKRAAAVAASFGINGRFRGSSLVDLEKYRWAVPSIASKSVKEGEKSAILVSSSRNETIDGVSVPRNSGEEVSDWEFTGCVEHLFDSLHDPSRRLVFGPVPTCEEAKEATSELKDALEKIYFFGTNGGNDSLRAVQGSTLSSLPSLGDSETKGCVTSDRAVILPSVPKPVFEAFALLNEIPEVQGVVASLASDKHVWEAVMKNEKLMEFCQSASDENVWETVMKNEKVMELNQLHQRGAVPEDMTGEKGNGEKQSSESTGNRFKEFLKRTQKKVVETQKKVVEMVRNLSVHFVNGGNLTEESSSTDGKGSPLKTPFGASFLALLIAVMMVILMKRV